MERDDIIEYSLDAHHSEEVGKKIRKKILMVTVLLTVITAVEVWIGSAWRGWFPDSVEETFEYVKLGFILMTIVKAGFIVMVFMHLGEERRALRAFILIPYGIFILYLIYMAMWESNYLGYMLDAFR